MTASDENWKSNRKTDPSAVHTFSHLSASIVLSRKRASEGFYPAVDPLQSRSVMLQPLIAQGLDGLLEGGQETSLVFHAFCQGEHPYPFAAPVCHALPSRPVSVAGELEVELVGLFR